MHRSTEGRIEAIVFKISILAMVALMPVCLNATAAYAQSNKAAGQPGQAAVIDLNNASQKELESLKGVGAATAKKIIAGRPYTAVDDLKRAGVSSKTIEGMRPYVTVGPAAAAATPPAAAPQASTPPAPSASAPAAPPAKAGVSKSAPAADQSKAAKLAPGQKVNINTGTKEQLEAIPGIGPTKAQAIIDGRPYQKIEDVMKVKGIKQGTFNKIKDYITTG